VKPKLPVVNADGGESVIMKIGGWLTRSVFIRYAIVSTTDMETAFKKLEKKHGKNLIECISSEGRKPKKAKSL
jgi:hypothetical protein